MRYILALSFVLFAANIDKSYCDEGILGKLTSGFKFAGQLLGIDRVTGVNQLVYEAFGSGKKVDSDDKDNNIFSSFLRIFGFDAKKVGAIAVNAIIFLAQLISTSLGKASPPPALEQEQAREIKEGNPFEWLTNNSNTAKIADHIQNKNLSEDVIEHIKEHSLDEDTDCLQLLICKLSPFVRGMQNALMQKKENDTGKTLLFKYMPTIEEVMEMGDQCEEKHPYCQLIY